MQPVEREDRLREGCELLDVAIQVCNWQLDRGLDFVLEHPAKASN